MPPPVMCASALSGMSAASSALTAVGVDAGRREQRVAERGAAEVDARQLELGLVAVDEHAAHEREAVGVQPARREAEHDVAGRDLRAVDHLGPVDDAHAEAGQVVLVGLHRAGVLGHLAADQRAAGLPAALGDAGDDRGDQLAVELADRDVVEEEERLGAGHEDVVRAHRDEVDSHRVVLAEQLREHELGAHAVGAGDHDRLVPCP